jgi:hypothetical protein
MLGSMQYIVAEEVTEYICTVVSVDNREHHSSGLTVYHVTTGGRIFIIEKSDNMLFYQVKDCILYIIIGVIVCTMTETLSRFIKTKIN